MKGCEARSEKGFLESKPVSTGAMAEENLRPEGWARIQVSEGCGGSWESDFNLPLR